MENDGMQTGSCILKASGFAKAKDLHSVSTMEQFMTKLCLHHQRQIVDAFGFLQSEMKSVTSSSEVQVSTALMLKKTKNSDCTEERSEIQHTEENLPAATEKNRDPDTPIAKNNDVSPLEQPVTRDEPLIASSKNGSFTALHGQLDTRGDNDAEGNSIEGSSPNSQPKCQQSNLGNHEARTSEVGPIIQPPNTAASEQCQCASDRQSHTNGNMDNDTVVLSPCSTSHEDPDPNCLPAHSNDAPVKPCSIQQTANAISPNSTRTAKKSNRCSYSRSRLGLIGNILKDPDIKYDIVYVGKPITECKHQTQNRLLPRKNARKSTRGHLSFGDCWEIKTVRTLARKSAQHIGGNYPVPMPEITTSVTPKQALAKPDGLPALTVPFTGDCMETVMNKKLSDQSEVTEIPGDIVELTSEDLIVEPSQTGQTRQIEQIPCLVSDEECVSLGQQDANVGIHDISGKSESIPESIMSTESSEKNEFPTKETKDAPALSVTSGELETEVCGQDLATETVQNTEFTSIENDASGAEILRLESDLMSPEQTKCLSNQVKTCSNDSLQNSCETEANVEAVDSTNLDNDKLEISAFVVEKIPTEDQLDKSRECVSESFSSKKGNSKPAPASDRCLRSGVSKGASEQTNVTNKSEQTKPNDLHLDVNENKDSKESLVSSKLKNSEENVSVQEGQCNVGVSDLNPEIAEQSPVVKEYDSIGNSVCTRHKQKLMLLKEMEIGKEQNAQEVSSSNDELNDHGCVVKNAAENEINVSRQSAKSPAKTSPGKSFTITERMPLRNRSSQSELSVSNANCSSPSKNILHTPERMPLRSRHNINVDPSVDCSSSTAAPVEENEDLCRRMPLRSRNSGLVDQTVGKHSPNSSLDSVARMPLRSRNCSAITVQINEGSSDVTKDTSSTITEEPSSEDGKKIANTGHIPVSSGSGPVAEPSSSLTSYGSDVGTVSESPGRMSLRRSNTLSADKPNCLPTPPRIKKLSPRLQKMSRTSVLSLVQEEEHNNNSICVKTEKLSNDQMDICSIPDHFTSVNLPATNPLIPSPSKFLEALKGEANQRLISDLNNKFEKMQKGWVQMDKEGQPAPKPKNKADRLKEIWKSKRRIRKPRSLEQQKCSPVQMLFMKSFDLPDICRWFLQSTETKSLVIVKKVNTRLPSETMLGFHTLPSVPDTSDGIFPSLQAERLKKHLKKFAIASPVKSNARNKRLIAKALAQSFTKGKEKQELRTATRISSKPQSSTGLTQTTSLENHSKVAASTKNPASARILRKYSNMREKKQVQQISLENLKRSLVEVDTRHSKTKVSKEKLSTGKKQKSAIVQKVKSLTKKAKQKIPRAGAKGLRSLNKNGDVSRRRVLPRFLKSKPVTTPKAMSKKETHLKSETSPQPKTDIKKSPLPKSPEGLSQSQVMDMKPLLSEDQVLTRSQRKIEATLAQTGSPRASTKRMTETSVTPSKRMRTSKIMQKQQEQKLSLRQKMAVFQAGPSVPQSKSTVGGASKKKSGSESNTSISQFTHDKTEPKERKALPTSSISTAHHNETPISPSCHPPSQTCHSQHLISFLLPSYCDFLFSSLHRLKEDGLLLDCVLELPGNSYQTHRLVLAAVSKKAEEWLCSQNIEVNLCNLGGSGSHITSAGLKAVLNFAYRGEVNMIYSEGKDLEEILVACRCLRVDRLTEVCVNKEAVSGKAEREQNLQVIRSLWKRRVGCDVIMKVESGECFPAHRVILAAGGDYFRALFCSGLRESNEDVVCLRGIASWVLESLLEFMYSGQFKLGWRNIWDLTEASLQFQLQGAQTLCLKFLHDQMNDASCLDTLLLAETYGLDSLNRAAEEYALAHFQQIAEKENFKDLTFALLERLLEKDELRVESEVEGCRLLRRHAEGREALQTARKLLSGNPTAIGCKPRIPNQVLVLVGGDSVNDNFERREPNRSLWFAQRFLRGEGLIRTIEWESLVQLPEPPRLRHCVCVLNNLLYILGGRKYYGKLDILKSVVRFSPAQDKWECLPDMASPRDYFAAVCQRGKVFVLGGNCDDTNYLDSVEYYTPEDNTWRLAHPLSKPVCGHAAAVLDGEIFISGGCDTHLRCLPSLWHYDPVYGCSNRAPMTTGSGRAGHVMFAVGNQLVVAGGLQPLQVSFGDQLECEAYDVRQNCWMAVPRLPRPHLSPAATCLDGMLYVLGGSSRDSGYDTPWVYRYDPQDRLWDKLGMMPRAYADLAACMLQLPQNI
ncbi:Kelch-like protein 33 [Bagarius yarrelli]|uniref:Kelch-like protein 33 n=1 Tax=Bagarius yarrelli TaxID=175774 RepID=A0A556V4K8_BAGYA|nr:Kelch-like protein 33 [Bagarius yarrelli]